MRMFNPDPIPIDILKRIIEAGVHTPTAGGGKNGISS